MFDCLTVRLFGPFAAISASGDDLLPRGSKARALVALLVTSETFQRRRSWLQDMLWSDRGPEQRAASLRQALVELRRCWAEIPDLLQTDRQSIGLDPKKVRIDRTGEGSGALFLEDVKVRDPAFVSWLRLQRLSVNCVAPDPARIEPRMTATDRTITVLCRSDHDPNAIALEHLVQDRVCFMLGECAGIRVRMAKALSVEPDPLLCSLKAILPESGPPVLRITLESLPGALMLFSGSTRPGRDPVTAADAPGTLALCAQLADIVRCHRSAAESSETVSDLVGEAVALMFSFEPAKTSAAVRKLETALSLERSGVIMGWLAQALNIQFVERHVTADAAFLERVEACCREALALAPTNSDVLASVANARVNFEKDYAAGFELARRAVEVNPANPLAWWALSNAELCIGRVDAALRSALRSQFLAQRTRYEFWADFQVALVFAVKGTTDAALTMGERSAALRPGFRPPLRYLVALHAMNGDLGRARDKVLRLVAEEEDFSVVRMLEDRSYPIGIMRRYGSALTESLKRLSGEL
ncbi:hypothetical protein [Litorisediminicola beolgyonensis]|uniref:SARP family transcriptional regulator n=1 Tax=Litorisediminicola beolgyonensis TaxID=1173614 RepID=A0ABW3ZLN7_9RHOB